MSQRLRAAALLAVGLPCCVSVLGLDDLDDAVAALCICDADVPQLDGRCAEVLGRRLDTVAPATRAAWLAFYVENCDGTCTNAEACFQQKGTCSVGACSERAECCGANELDSTLRCIDELCAECRAEGDACSDATDCCDDIAECTDGSCHAPEARPAAG